MNHGAVKVNGRLPADWHLAGFDLQPRTRLVFGNDSLEKVGALARELGANRVLLVTDKGIVAAGHASRAVGLLEAAGLHVAVFDSVRENPTTKDVARCLALAREHKTDLFVGLGGGSSMDTAKGTNFLLTNGGEMKDYWGVGKAKLPMLPLIAIPTTAGTGSECQCAALIAEEESHLKMACLDPKAVARVAILDPLLTVSQPARVTACVACTCTLAAASPSSDVVGDGMVDNAPGTAAELAPRTTLWHTPASMHAPRICMHACMHARFFELAARPACTPAYTFPMHDLSISNLSHIGARI